MLKLPNTKIHMCCFFYVYSTSLKAHKLLLRWNYCLIEQHIVVWDFLNFPCHNRDGDCIWCRDTHPPSHAPPCLFHMTLSGKNTKNLPLNQRIDQNKYASDHHTCLRHQRYICLTCLSYYKYRIQLCMYLPIMYHTTIWCCYFSVNELSSTKVNVT